MFKMVEKILGKAIRKRIPINITIPITNPSGKVVGHLIKDKGIYSRLIDYNQNEMFKHPKYENGIAISRSILKKLISLGCQKFQFQILNFEEKPFEVMITIKDFLQKREEIYFEGKPNADPQFMVRLKYWTRLYKDQQTLE